VEFGCSYSKDGFPDNVYCFKPGPYKAEAGEQCPTETSALTGPTSSIEAVTGTTEVTDAPLLASTPLTRVPPTSSASTGPMSTTEVTTASLEDLAAKMKTTWEKMESVETDIAEAETTKAAAEDISNKIDSLDMNTFITGSRFRRQDGSTTYPSPANCNDLKSSMTDLANAIDINAPDYDPEKAANIVKILTNLDASTLSPGCSSTDLSDRNSAKNAAKDNADAVVTIQTNLISAKNDEFNACVSELIALREKAPAPLTGHCKGTSSNTQCNVKPNGTPCTKDCVAPDCQQSKCCHGCCKRGNVLFSLGC